MEARMKKEYTDNIERNNDLRRFLNNGYIITKIYGDGIKQPLTLEYEVNENDVKRSF